MRHVLLQIAYDYRSLMAREPALAVLHRPSIWWHQFKYVRKNRARGATAKDCFVGDHTELVIDGFQGSGNSFAAEAFRIAQSKSVQVAHHLHSPAQIIKAVGLRLPILVTIREPAEAVASLISRWPYVPIPQALRIYCRFYEKIEPCAGEYVLSPFIQTTRHLDIAIGKVNQRFGTDFDLFECTDEKVRQVRDPMRRSSREIRRQTAKKRIIAELANPKYHDLLARAEGVYQRLAESAPNQPRDVSG